MKKIFFGLLCAYLLCFTSFLVFAEKNDFVIIPEAEQDNRSQYVEDISNSGGHVRDEYNNKAYEIGGAEIDQEKVGTQLASGIMTRDTIIDYFVYALQFMSQLGLLIGTVMIIYTGYRYAAYSFLNDKPDSGAITYAIYGVLIIIFSYAIMKLLTRAFLT